MEYSITVYFALFMIYSVAGWICEELLQIIQNKKIADRGFLIGPYCPIYGCGVILITICLTPFENHPVGLFILTMVLCGVLEYATSFIMEKAFNARWWDYSNMRFNINGRICVPYSIFWGILAVFLIKIAKPLIDKWIKKM